MRSDLLQLGAIERHAGAERLVVAYSMATGLVEIAIERRTLDGWRCARRIAIGLHEAGALRKALDRAAGISAGSKPVRGGDAR